MSEHFATFINNFTLSIVIETWQTLCFGFISEMKRVIVRPGEKIIMGSDTGEWLINSFIFDKDICDQWIAAGYKSSLGQYIGKFRDSPCIRCDYSWMYRDEFVIVYDKAERIAIFSKK
jgi:hypothetical protein